jgi:anti-sigma factor (TIGR02949 family)
MAQPRGPDPDDLACVDLVNSVTEYLDGELDEDQRTRIERHLEECPGCRAALDQFQTVIRLAGRLTGPDDLDPGDDRGLDHWLELDVDRPVAGDRERQHRAAIGRDFYTAVLDVVRRP